MNPFLSALWAEALKARRSKVLIMTVGAYLILPTIDGLFMFILKDPARARAMGLLSVKAQLTAGTADWPSFFMMFLPGTAVGGSILCAFITAWVFGREFSDQTAKELLAVPTQRGVIITAKLVVIAVWMLGLCLQSFIVLLGIGKAVGIPGWSPALAGNTFWIVLLVTLLTFMLMPAVALFASIGRGYLPPLFWAFLTMIMAQIAIVLGWADWFPWAVPALLVNMNGPDAPMIGVHSYLVVLLVFVIGIVATIEWWQSADQAR